MSEATEETQRKRNSKGTPKPDEGWQQCSLSGGLWDNWYLSLFKAFAYIQCFALEEEWEGRKGHKNWNPLKIYFRNVLTQADTCSSMEGECSTARHSCCLVTEQASLGVYLLFRLLPVSMPNSSVFLHLVSCVFFGGVSAKEGDMKHCWAGCDGLNLLLCLNSTTVWHLPWTSRALSPLLPYGQHCGLKISLISQAGLRLAQIYLDDVIIILSQPITKVCSQILHMGAERNAHVQGKDHPWLKSLLGGGRVCVESKNCSFLRTVQALYIYLSNSFFLTLTFYVPCPVLCSWCVLLWLLLWYFFAIV